MRKENQIQIKVPGSLLVGLLAAFSGSLFVLLGAYSPVTDVELQAGLAGAGWTGVVFVFLSLFLLSVYGILAAVFLFLLRKFKFFTKSESSAADPDRRQFINQAVWGGLILLSAGLTRIADLHGAELPVARVIPVPVKGLPRDLDGFRIVHITDIHADPFTSRGWVEAVVRIANSLAPHVIAITGDLADGSVKRMAGIVQPLADLAAPFGRYFVTGNHEYHVSAQGVENWISHLEHLGFHVLLNNHRLLTQGNGTVLLGGVTDYSAGYYFPGHASSPAAAIRGAAPADVRILMAHQPKSVFEAAEAGFDFQFSGHTHGGQLFPCQILMAITQPFVSGMHRFRDTLIYVNSGAGCLGPKSRLGSTAEIAAYVLRTA